MTPKQQPDSTREKFIEAATDVFAEKGFHGASIAAIAAALGLTKQALLHHFGSKEKLYGEVLARISGNIMRDMDQVQARRDGSGDGLAAGALLEAFLMDFHRIASSQGREIGLLIRELLDNEQRAEKATNWYLKPFLEALTDLALAQPGWQGRTRGEALAAVYQMLGVINYFAISKPTLSNMFGPDIYADTEEHFARRLRPMIRACLAV